MKKSSGRLVMGWPEELAATSTSRFIILVNHSVICNHRGEGVTQERVRQGSGVRGTEGRGA